MAADHCARCKKNFLSPTMKVACVVVLLLAVFSAVVQARDHNEACFDLLLAKYEVRRKKTPLPLPPPL